MNGQLLMRGVGKISISKLALGVVIYARCVLNCQSDLCV